MYIMTSFLSGLAPFWLSSARTPGIECSTGSARTAPLVFRNWRREIFMILYPLLSLRAMVAGLSYFKTSSVRSGQKKVKLWAPNDTPSRTENLRV